MGLERTEIDIKNQVFEYFPSMGIGYNQNFNNDFVDRETDPTHSISLNSSWDIFNNGRGVSLWRDLFCRT